MRIPAMTETAPSRSDLWCNCQATTPNAGPWHPLGDTSSCPAPETPTEFCRWLLTLDDPEDVLGRTERAQVTLTQIIRRARAALAAATGGPGE